MENEALIKANALEYVNKNTRALVEQYAGNAYPSVEEPVSVYMAGSPGAGKTELSKRLIEEFEEIKVTDKFVRIDPDEIRISLPGYTGSNAYLFQHAATVAAERIHDHALHKKKSYFFDSTFSNLDKARLNVNRCLKRNREIIIVYSYLNPIDAWDITQKREKLNSRKVPKEDFIDHYFNARKNIDVVDKEYGDKVNIMVFYREHVKSEYTLYEAIEIDKIIKNKYSHQSLRKILK